MKKKVISFNKVAEVVAYFSQTPVVGIGAQVKNPRILKDDFQGKQAGRQALYT